MLHINDLTYRIGPRLLFDQATVAIPTGAKVGFVGRNGAGKTTLFAIISGDVIPESGGYFVPRNTRIGRVAQEAPGGPETLMQVVLAADTERAALLAESETATGPHRIAEIETRLADIGAHSAEARAAAILHGLASTPPRSRLPCSDFSGGWRMRVALAAVLFAEPDLLLLDEPTNYLDLEGTLWLYDYLGRYPHTAVVISHDRELLDTAVDHILHLDGGKLTFYRGGYSSFDRQRREKLTLQAKARDRQEAERKHLQAFVDRFRAKASKARQAQSRIKRLEKMEPIAAVVEADVLPFAIPGPERPLSPPLIAFEGAAAGYGERVVLDRLDLTLLPDDRVALLGPNGNGKSTFAKLITGRLAPMRGEVKRSPKLRHAYFAQHQLDELDEAGTPLSHVSALMPQESEARRRAAAARIGFPGQKAETSVTRLSGGEKARLQLGLATHGGAHLVVLDEPTNHLDIDSRAALAEAINDYSGAMILISHDRYLIEATCDRLWLVADGTVKPYDGDLDEYRRLVLSGGSAGRRRGGGRDQGPPPAAERKDAEKRGAAQPLKRRIAAIEDRIEKLTGLIARVDAALADGEAFRLEPTKARELARQRNDLKGALDAAEGDWLAASGEMEAAEQG